MGRGGLGNARRRCQQAGERTLRTLGAGDDDLGLGLRQQCQRRPHRRQHRRRDDDRARPAVGQHKGEFVGPELGIDRDWHDPGLDRAEEGARKIDSIMQAEEDALFAAEAEAAQDIGKPGDPFGKLCVAVLAAIVDDRDLRPAPGSEVALDQVGGGVVGRPALHRR